MQLFWVSVKWLKEFIRSDKPVPIDNSDIMCPHGKGLSPYDIKNLKCVSDISWSKLLSYCGGGTPCVMGLQVCPECLERYCKHMSATSRKQAEVDHIKELLGQKIEPPNGYFIAKSALSAWRKNPACLPGLNILTDVMCEHGDLKPGKKAVELVCPEVWLYFAEATHPMKFFTGSKSPCSLCLESNKEKKEHSKDLYKERKSMYKTFSDYTKIMDTNYTMRGTFYAVERKWYNEFKTWMSAHSATSQPEKLDNKALICKEHGKLLVDVNTPDIDKSRFVLMDKALWNIIESKYVSPECKEIKIQRQESGGVAVVTPETCYECIIRMAEADNLQKMHFVNSYVMVSKLPDIYDSEEDVLKAAVAAEKDSSIAIESEKRYCKYEKKRGIKQVKNDLTFVVLCFSHKESGKGSVQSGRSVILYAGQQSEIPHGHKLQRQGRHCGRLVHRFCV